MVYLIIVLNVNLRVVVKLFLNELNEVYYVQKTLNWFQNYFSYLGYYFYIYKF